MIRVSREIPVQDLSTIQVVQRIKAQHPNLLASEAYSRFVQARNLRPEISMLEFKDIFDSVGANLHRKTCEVTFNPTHVDTATNRKVQVVPRQGFHEITWENGMTGTEPGKLSERYQECG